MMRQSEWKTISRTAGILLLAVVFSSGGGLAQSPPEKGSKRLPRAYEGAPPLVPHDVESRKGVCLSCHGTGEEGAPITPHPNRTHFCIQCHVGQDLSVQPFVEGK